MIQEHHFEYLWWLMEDLKKRAGGRDTIVDGLIEMISERLKDMEKENWDA